MEQGSYLLIKPGMAVLGSDGHLGTVKDVVADIGADVFRGITVSHGLLNMKHDFVAADDVVSVDQDNVRIGLSKSDLENIASTSES